MPTSTRPSPTAVIVALVRLAIAALVIAAVAATLADALSRGPVNPFNFFGFFTIQSNIMLTVVLIIAAVQLLRGRPNPAWFLLVRGAVTTFIIIVGLVYVALLAPLGAAGGVPVEWANVVMHYVTPIYGLVDWLLVGDRRRLAMRQVVWVLVYPLVWVTVVLIRGATDGWVPYPFLSPETGYASVFGYVAAIVAVFIVIGVIVFALSRVPAVLRVTRE
ncbi:MAG: Pr6Pr family membrane protein [Microcella pacifica]|uniref:Pr6Pr family membrane protein n=1 Tax=Microcella pacifica TaxID=2591847 RepID=UPI00331536D2